jgi:hypothetical protein
MEKATMKPPPWLMLALIAVWLSACTTVKVSQDYDPATDFSDYRTFDWYPGPQPKTGDIRVDNPLLDDRIREAVTRELISKGFRRVTDQMPDLYTAYHLTIRTKLEADTLHTGIGYGRYPYYGGFGTDTWIRQYDEGMLVIDIADAEKNELIWRGVGTRRVTETRSPQRSTEVVNKTVAEILAQFPPGPNPSN